MLLILIWFQFLLLEDESNESFLMLKKMSRDYQEISQALSDSSLSMQENLKLEQRQENLVKMALIVEDPCCFAEFKSQRREAKEKERMFDLNRGYSIDRQAVLVWQGGHLQDLADLLKLAKDNIPFDEAHLLVKTSLQEAVDCCISNDVILLAPGAYQLENLGDLSSCLTLIGLDVDSRKEVKIVLDCGYGFEMLFQNPGSFCSLTNLTLTSKSGQSGIWARKGARVEIKDCRLLGFHTALKVDPEAQVSVRYSEIQACHCAFDAAQGCLLKVQGGLVEDCNIGFVLEEAVDLQAICQEMDNYALVKSQCVKK